MSKSKRGRRSGGHPAKVAAKRERDAARRADQPPSLGTVVRRMAKEVGALDSPFDAEVWASDLLGSMYEERSDLPVEEAMDDSYTLAFGEELIHGLAQLSDRGAPVALAAIAAVDGTELGVRSRELLQGSTVALPAWAAELGRSEITAAGELRETVFDDARTVMLEARNAKGEVMTVGVTIDHNSGGMARSAVAADTLDSVAEAIAAAPSDGEEDGVLAFSRIAPGVAAGWIEHAIDVTDRTWKPDVTEDFFALRALALARTRSTPDVVLPVRPELSEGDRDALKLDFLAAPEGSGWAADGEEALVASLIIDFCSDYGDGDPLRFSPLVVESFMVDWFPRKVFNYAETIDRVPDVMRAWARYAGRRRGLPAWAIEQTCHAVDECEPPMREEAGETASSGASVDFFDAVRAAGIDLDNEVELKAFTAGWNARSMLQD